MNKLTSHIPCAWCGSTDTHLHAIRNWEEDEIGNEILTADYSDEYSPRDEIWWCDDCDDKFVVMCSDDEESGR